ncbi:Heat shock protein HSP20 [uncultured Pleomorphomonas sp.]|uniref:Heat shock protein HSP20 n=1 Tax=uncultured Pleomorphomonas sp. TaxID=442121 RepID=A0A212L2D8_9HYPH|nr:Hsp20/alpha crystallin family protein [uncultured Pleomorphomonas sp.]SCM71705.1 Heat shock protein HSP20 [uncultured Pleomorphomonas sp.]
MDKKSLMPFGRGSAPSRSREDPFLSLRHEMDQLFDSFTRGWGLPTLASGGDGFLSPRVDIAETETGLEMTAELPGIDPKAIELELEDDMLTLKAERKSDREEKDDKRRYHLTERSTGTYMRAFTLPFTPDRDKITAEFDKGVLKVTVPRSPDQPKATKRIDIRPAA